MSKKRRFEFSNGIPECRKIKDGEQALEVLKNRWFLDFEPRGIARSIEKSNQKRSPLPYRQNRLH